AWTCSDPMALVLTFPIGAIPGATDVRGETVAVAPAAAAAFPPAVGGAMFFGFSVLLFCFICAWAFGSTPDQPFSTLASAIFVFTVGGAISFAGLLIFIGAATTKA